ncbi:MAG: hypothetical protein NZM29_03000, partial [Nitrospira sp.]|nr:hypothetical protein [Nitrospira sp.]
PVEFHYEQLAGGTYGFHNVPCGCPGLCLETNFNPWLKSWARRCIRQQTQLPTHSVDVDNAAQRDLTQ